MPRGSPITEEIKAAVRAALLSGMSVMDAAREYKLPHATISRIRAELGPATMDEVGREKRSRIDDLLIELLASNVGAMKRFADTTSEQDYIRQQTAGDIAELYREIASTTLRLLEAASAVEIEAGDTEDTEAGT